MPGGGSFNEWKTSAPSFGISGRKIFRRLTSPLAATLPAVAVSWERGTVNDFSRRFRVRQIERLLLRTLRSPESVGIPVRACVGPPLGCVPLQLFDYFLRGTRQSHFTRAPRIRRSPVRKHRFCECDRMGSRGLRPVTLPHHRTCGFPHPAVETGTGHLRADVRIHGRINP